MMEENMNRNRPYDGQQHTHYGKRGKTLVEGLTMRDISDCCLRGFLLASGHIVPHLYSEADKGEKAQLSVNDLYGFDLDKIDPGAVIQNMICEIEKMMEIYPNVNEVAHEQDR